MKFLARFFILLSSLVFFGCCAETDDEILKKIPAGKKLSELSAPLQIKAKKHLRQNLKRLYESFNIHESESVKTLVQNKFESMMNDDKKLIEAINDAFVYDVLQSLFADYNKKEFDKGYEDLIVRVNETINKDLYGTPQEPDLKKEYLQYKDKMTKYLKTKLGIDAQRLEKLLSMNVIEGFLGFLTRE